MSRDELANLARAHHLPAASRLIERFHTPELLARDFARDVRLDSPPHTEALELVVRGPAPGRLRAREIARALSLPLAGTLRLEPDLARALERGTPPAGTGKGPLAELCQRVLAELPS